MQKPHKLSIVLATFNCVDTLQNCLNSIAGRRRMVAIRFGPDAPPERTMSMRTHLLCGASSPYYSKSGL